MDTKRTKTRSTPGDWLKKQLVPRAYDRHILFEEIFARVAKIFRLDDLLRYLAQTMMDRLDLSSLTILVKHGSVFEVMRTAGNVNVSGVPFPVNSSAISHLRRNARPTILDKGRTDPWRMLATKDEVHALDRLHAQMLLPFVGRTGLVGFAALAQRGNRGFSLHDLYLFRELGRHVGLALEAAMTLEDLSRESAHRASANRELELAREVQERMFPQRIPAIPGATIAGRCVSAQAVGGDYYDIFLTVDGDICFALGDVSGKGISSALLMATLRASLRTLILDNDLSPTQLVFKLNRLIHEASAENRFATFAVFFYKPRSRSLTYVNAGHNPPLLLRGKEVIRLESGGPVLGLFPDCTYEQETIQIEPGDLLLVYSDGVTESINPAGDEWCEEGLIAAMRHRRKGATAVVEDVFKSLQVFAAGTPQPDDITLLAFEADGIGKRSQGALEVGQPLPIDLPEEIFLALE
ncbi:sigma-B regulation protein RsbU (phosphoserine phosphatase) [Granulicella aggregans]|uniref:Sigma-B regulation protein RsbU (Phosphoserine phosphatase) n=1 Tax=Granulicella aggregans TaxID=474949 RepID=A0A7W8E2G5_9BACT|nr:GAF domain-containing SpoIIE family protein phosphatase [Granulicella aggregans]MBB5056164.1 sigma-B regulation protein RsbU (phosphoserine phosphatase) [Granulicella aggregans]